MGEFLGIRDETLTLGKLGVRFQLYSEIKKLLRQKGIVLESRDNLKKQLKIHNIAKIKEDKDAMNAAATEAAVASHKLVFRDLLLLDQELKTLQRVIESNNEILKKISEKSKHYVRLKRMNNELAGVLKGVEDDLRKERAAIFDLEKTAKGDVGVALAFKGLTRGKKFNAITRVAMKWEARWLAKDERRVEKIEDDLNRLRAKVKAGKFKEKELDDVEGKEKTLVAKAKEEAEKSYKLLLNDYLTMNIIIGVLSGDLKSDEELMAKYEIPRVLGELDVAQKRKILNEVEKKLQSERTVIKQVWADDMGALRAVS